MSGEDTLDIEIIEIRDFIAARPAFELLPTEELDRIAKKIQVRYLRSGTTLMAPGDRVEMLSIVRSGALETHSPEGQLLARLDEGEAAGVRALLRGGQAVNQIIAIEDSLIYQIPAKEFHQLREAYPQFAYFYGPQGAARLRGAMDHASSGGDQMGLVSRRVAELVGRKVITITPAASVRDAARVMTENRVSCILVTDDDLLVGILTDRDLRTRIVVEGRSVDTAVSEVMSRQPMSIDASSLLFDALLTMTRNSIHHLPVVRDGRPIGVITSNDILRTQTRSVVFLAGDIHRQTTAEDMAKILTQVPHLVHEMVASGAGAYTIGHAVSALTDATTERLIKLAEDRFGPAPVPYCWIAAGSQARFEQTAQSDQDNCLVLADSYDAAQHGAYFKDFADFVCAGLDTCGYVFCPGDVMAKTDEWRQPLKVWRGYFHKWVNIPDPKALMLASVFFDMRPIAGDFSLFETLHADVLNHARGNGIFLAYMVQNALTHQPPLGLFRHLVVIHGGEHNNTLDLKHTGVVPIVDLARVYALDAGIEATNTQDRLQAISDGKIISKDGARDLIAALEFLGLTRLHHQARQIREGTKADNYMPPQELSSFERSHLRDAFSVVKSMQAAAATRYRGGMG